MSNRHIRTPAGWRRHAGLRKVAVVAPPSTTQPTPRTPPAPAPSAPIIDWQAVDTTLPRAKIFASVLGWGNSLATNIIDFALLQQRIWASRHGDAPGPFPLWGILAGFVVFLLLTGGQIYTINRSRWGYRATLVPDVLMTALPWGLYIIMPIVALFVPPMPALPVPHLAIAVVSGIIAAGIGLASAKLPERLIFGERG